MSETKHQIPVEKTTTSTVRPMEKPTHLGKPAPQQPKITIHSATDSCSFANDNQDGDISSGARLSNWFANATIPKFPKLDRNIEDADVVIVGAGIAGLSTAYRLFQAQTRPGGPSLSLKIIVLEAREIGSGETGRSTAHCAWAVDDRFFNLQKAHGDSGAKLVAESHAAAIDWIEEICKTHEIVDECEFKRVNGFLMCEHLRDDPHYHASEKIIVKELKSLYELGLSQGIERHAYSVQKVPGLEADSGEAILFRNQAQINPLAFVCKLAEILRDSTQHRQKQQPPQPVSVSSGAARETTGTSASSSVDLGPGVHIFTHSRVVSVTGGKDAKVVTSDGFEVRAGHCVVATNVPINNRIALIDRVEPYRSYVIAGRVPKDSVPHELYWDTADPYHYVRVAKDPTDAKFDLLIVGGEDHKVGRESCTVEPFHRLENWTRKRWPQFGQVTYKWSGQILEPVDHIAYTGRNVGDADNVYVHTGDSGNGITHGMIAGMIIPDLIQGRENKFAKLYDTRRSLLRKDVHSQLDYLSHNLSTQFQYAKWFGGSDKHVRDIEDMPKCTGAVIRQGTEYVAVYKDTEGQTRKMSAKCPHLSGVLVWNDVEKSFDCPVHGSRFDKSGKCENGPAHSDLPQVK